VQDQPTGETPQQIVERELRAAQEQVRRVAEQLRAGLAADDRVQAEMQHGTKDEH
jgi:HAMP domain-containing protein